MTEELDDELLVYDEGRHTACRLNRTAALIWRHADGERSISELVEVLRSEIELADEDLVMVTLDRLHEHGLIESGFAGRDPQEARMSRRRFIRRVGVVGSAALALPVVQSMVAPTAAAAQSACSCACGEACYCPCRPPKYCTACYCSYCTACSTCYCTTCGPPDQCNFCAPYCNGVGYCSALARPDSRARKRW